MKAYLFLLTFSPFFMHASAPLKQPTVEPLTVKKLTIEQLTVEQAIQRGNFDRESLQAIQAEAQALTCKGRSHMSKWLPQHRITTGIDHASGKTGGDSTPSFFELSTTQLLATGVSPYDNYAITKGQREAIDAEYLAKKDSIRFSIEKSFFQAWLINEQRKRIDSLSYATKSVFAQQKAEYREDLIDKPTWQSKEAEFMTNITEVKNYDQLYENAQADLSFSMGIFNYRKFEPIWTPQKIRRLEKLSRHLIAAFEQRKELKIIDSQIQTKNIEIAKTLKGYLPSVSAFASVYLQEGHPGSPQSNKNGGLQLSWNIGDGVSQYFDAEHLRALQMKLKKNRIALKKKIKNEVVITYNNVIAAMRTLTSKGFTLRAAHAALKKKEQEKKLGIITKSDHDDALHRLEQERFIWITARIEYEIEYRTLAFATGYGI
ncbi:TolC family protein [Candidatus Babeliales bacterium]|nr:TolC family protein [Candidatus Babeliales bacterium]